MARWSDLATWRGPTLSQGGVMREHRGCVEHIAEGTYEGTISWQRGAVNKVSSHFIVARDGRIAQMVDTDVTAWTQSAGNGFWLSIENEGFTPASVHYRSGWELLTAQQIEANAKIFATGHRVYGYPLQLAVNPDGRGLGHHSMGCKWPGGAWGHCDCPGPAIIGQKQDILRRAIEIANGDNDMTPEERQMLAELHRDRQVAPWQYKNVDDAKVWQETNPGQWFPDMHAVVWDTYRRVKALEAPELTPVQLTPVQLDTIAVKAGEHAAALIGGKLDALLAEVRRANEAEKAGLQAELGKLTG